MLTRLIVSFYSGLIEIALWLLIAVGGIAGYKLTSTVGGGDSAFIGGVVGAAVVFVIAAVLFGGFLVLDDVRRSVRRIEVLAEEDRGSKDFTHSQVAPSANSRTDKMSINAAVAPKPAQAPVPSNLMSTTEYAETSGMTQDQVVAKLRDGSLDGRYINEAWYVRRTTT